MDDALLTWPQLVALGGSRDRARRLLADGLYRRVFHGVYVDDAVADSPLLRCRALRLALPPDVVLSGRTALWAVGVDVLPRDGLLDVTTRRGLHLMPRPGLAPHSALLPDTELTDLPGGLVAVTAARAVVDVARREPLVEAVACGDAVLRSGAATADQLAQAVARARGLRGIVRARQVLPHLEPRAESQGESRLRMQLVLGGLPRPEAQVDYYDEHGIHLGRADLVLEGVVLEYHGREQRLRKDVFAHDRHRQNGLVDRGVELRRFTARDVAASRRIWLCGQVLRAVAVAASRPAPTVVRGPDTLRPPRLTPLPARAEVRRPAA